MKANELNAIASLLNTTDKNLVISVAIKTLIDSGLTISEALDLVLGEGAFSKIAGQIYDNLKH